MEDLSFESSAAAVSGGLEKSEDLPALPTNKSITQSKTQVLDAEAVQHLKEDIQQLVAKPSSTISTSSPSVPRKAETKANSKAVSKANSPHNSRPVSRNISRHASISKIKTLSRQASTTQVTARADVSSVIMKEMKEEGSIDKLSEIAHDHHSVNNEIPEDLVLHHLQKQKARAESISNDLNHVHESHVQHPLAKHETSSTAIESTPFEKKEEREPRLERKPSKLRDKSEERPAKLERKESKYGKDKKTSDTPQQPNQHTLARMESKKSVIRQDPEESERIQSGESQQPPKPVKTESRKSISQQPVELIDHQSQPPKLSKTESRKSISQSNDEQPHPKPLTRLESKKSLQKLPEDISTVSEESPPPVPSIPKQFHHDASQEQQQQASNPKPLSRLTSKKSLQKFPEDVITQTATETAPISEELTVQRFEPKPPLGPPPSEYKSPRGREESGDPPVGTKLASNENPTHQPTANTNPPISSSLSNIKAAEAIRQISVTVCDTASVDQHASIHHNNDTAHQQPEMTPLPDKKDPAYESAVSAPCLVSSSEKHGSAHSIQTIAGDGSSRSPHGSAHDLRHKVKRGSKENLGSAHNSPRSSVTLRHTSSTRNGSMRSIRSRKAVELDRCMSPSTVLNTLPRATSSASIKPEINNKQMSKFLSGFRRFQKTYFGDNSELFDSLKNGQSPKTLLIACCDSRVDPAIITDCEPGDLFVVRNVANLVAPYNPDKSHHGVSAALEFAVKGLKVNNIIVMGHTKCGGIAALMRGISDSNETEFLGPWMKIAEKARQKVLK
ncbi:UNVERIFIED_CONTAM: hypothetical protein HDU68_010740 [Siphonaria sp. JEL0065]|nr:hypothetical protein HDU68_010740 [Siphonaria sp. JEL0065]